MTLPLGRAQIEAIIPHRAPFLLVDEVVELDPGRRALARRTVTEEDCAGHFPGNPIMPGEALPALVGGILHRVRPDSGTSLRELRVVPEQI